MKIASCQDPNKFSLWQELSRKNSEMTLVEYSDSEKEEEDIKASSVQQLPPLPKGFFDKYAANARVGIIDDPTLHDGRMRGTPHVPGDWSTHVFIEWFPTASERQLLCNLLSVLRVQNCSQGSKLKSFLVSELGAPEPLHVSLSRSTIAFQTDNKDDFLSSLKLGVTSSKIKPFEFCIIDLYWFQNDEKTRWFLVLKIKADAEIPQKNPLNVLLHISNQTVQQYDQPPLYAAPMPKKLNGIPKVYDASDHFHISIGWSLTEPDVSFLEKVSTQLDAVKKITINVEDIKVKIGSDYTRLGLAQANIAETKLFG